MVAQHQDKVDFIHADVTVSLEPQAKKVDGVVRYSFTILKDVDSIFLDAKNMDILWINLNGEKTVYTYDNKRIVLSKAFKKDEQHVLDIKYTCVPKQTVYFLGFDDTLKGNEQIWTQGQGKYTSHWLPSFDDMNQKVEFDLAFDLLSNGWTVVANGTSKVEKNNHDGKVLVQFDMKSPMSSYLVAFAIGNFKEKTIRSSSGVPLRMYYEPKDSLKFEPTYRHTKAIFDFLEEEIGTPYPWQNYKQIPVRDFLYAGMENTGTTIFSNGYVIDTTAFTDKNYVNVNAHELAHQWFGNLVTEKGGKHHWLHEGFATYYAYLAEKKLFGDDHFYWKLHAAANTLNNLSENGDGDALTNPNANSLTFYEKGALALVLLKDRVGEAAFKKGTKNFLNKYRFANATIADFLREIAKASGEDLSRYREEWLESDEFPWKSVVTFFRNNNNWLGHFLSMDASNGVIVDWKSQQAPWQYLTHMMDRNKSKLSMSDYTFFLRHKEIKVRQKALQLLDTVPVQLEQEVTQLLTDPSYVTIENALYKLWASFPDKAANYLNQTEKLSGLPNKNIQLLWLVLALATPEYKTGKKKEYYQRLNSFTNKTFHFEIRQQAFQYLAQLQAMNENTYFNLIAASEHHVWQFKKSSRNLLRELYRSENGKTKLDKLRMSLPTKQQEMLIKVLAK